MVLTTKTTEQIVNAVIAELIQQNLDITDYNIGSIVRTIVEAIANQIGYNGDTDSLYQLVYSVYLNSRIETATEDSLDQLGLLVGVERDSGSKAVGDVTFKRTTNLTNDLTIPANTIVATAPNDEGGQKQFITLSGTTFQTLISQETHTYVDGIYDYPLNSRFFETVTQLSGVSGSGVKLFTKDTDYTIEDYDGYYLDTDEDYIVLDDFESTSGWSGVDCTVASGTDAKQGDFCLDIVKSDDTVSEVYIDKTVSSVDVNNLLPHIWIKVEDETILNKIETIKLYVGNAGIANSINFELNKTDLSVGYNQYYPQTFVINGNPNLQFVDFIRIKLDTTNADDTLVEGNLSFDFFVMGEIKYHVGKTINFIKEAASVPNDETEWSITYKPRSVDILCEAFDVGSQYNVSSNKITYKVSSLPDINSINNYSEFTAGTEAEIDDDYRERIKNESSSAGKATINSIKNAVSNIDGIRSVSAEDLPLRYASREPHIYNPLVDTYTLWNQVVYLNDSIAPTNIDIGSGYSSSGDFIYGTDYEIENGKDLTWLSGGTTPASGSSFYVDYSYNWLGHGLIYVFGDTYPLSTILRNRVSETISGVISGTKAAGIQIDWEEATQQYINVEASITFKNGYSLTQAKKEEITVAINNYIINLDVGDTVIYNEIVKTIMSVEGVYNCSVSLPAADTTIDSNKIALLGSVLLT